MYNNYQKFREEKIKKIKDKINNQIGGISKTEIDNSINKLEENLIDLVDIIEKNNKNNKSFKEEIGKILNSINKGFDSLKKL